MAHPEMLYRYQPLSVDRARERQLFTDNKLYFVSPETFNDPFDTKPHFVFSKNGEISLDDARRLVAKVKPHLSAEEIEAQAEAMRNHLADPQVSATVRDQNRAQQQKNFYGNSVRCFCETYDNLLQWAHYGDSHKGYCVAFQLPKIWPYTRDDGDEASIPIVKTHYRKEYATIDLDLDLHTQEAKRQIFDALLTKSTHWEYEQEWRALRVACKPGAQPLPNGAIRSVILGCRMKDSDRNDLIEIVSTHPTEVEIVEGRPLGDKFEFEFFLSSTVGGKK